MEYVQGIYNPNEHNFVERSDDELQKEIADLHISLKNIEYSGDRLAQIQRRIGNISFELSERYRESKAIDSELAWAERNLDLV